jgi:hypothetical protein
MGTGNCPLVSNILCPTHITRSGQFGGGELPILPKLFFLILSLVSIYTFFSVTLKNRTRL